MSDQLSQPLAGQVVVFSGKLSSLGRRDARALVERLGGITSDHVTLQTTLVVVADETAVGSEKTPHVRHAEDLNQQGSAIRILPEGQFCELAGVPSPEVLRRQYHASRDLLARYPSITDDQLRTLVKWGVIQPAVRTSAGAHFDFAALSVIRQVNDEVSRGASFRSALRALLASRQGQLSFDFRLDVEPAKILTLPRRQPPAGSAALLEPGPIQHDTGLAEEYFKVGSALDAGDDSMKDQAATAYRRALELDPYLVAALINLANIHYGRDELVEAQALYERAIGLESDFFEAHFNLGNIYHDLNRFAEATACYEKALKLNPHYADANFYLAVTLEKMGRSQIARPHWKTYQQLAPQGEWAELAKEFSE